MWDCYSREIVQNSPASQYSHTPVGGSPLRVIPGFSSVALSTGVDDAIGEECCVGNAQTLSGELAGGALKIASQAAAHLILCAPAAASATISGASLSPLCTSGKIKEERCIIPREWLEEEEEEEVTMVSSLTALSERGSLFI